MTGLQELMVLSMLMFDRHHVEGVMRVFASSVRAVTGCELVEVRRRREHLDLLAGTKIGAAGTGAGNQTNRRAGRFALAVHYRDRGILRNTRPPGAQERDPA